MHPGNCDPGTDNAAITLARLFFTAIQTENQGFYERVIGLFTTSFFDHPAFPQYSKFIDGINRGL